VASRFRPYEKPGRLQASAGSDADAENSRQREGRSGGDDGDDVDSKTDLCSMRSRHIGGVVLLLLSGSEATQTTAGGAWLTCSL
jgi:hypothetical protein